MSATDDVARMIATAEQAPTSDEIVESLKSRHSEQDVLGALEFLHREIVAEEGVDGRWTWLGPPPGG